MGKKKPMKPLIDNNGKKNNDTREKNSERT